MKGEALSYPEHPSNVMEGMQQILSKICQTAWKQHVSTSCIYIDLYVCVRACVHICIDTHEDRDLASSNTRYPALPMLG